MRCRGFTFVEILVSLALVGVIAICAVAPIMYSIRNMNETQLESGEASAIDDVFNLICRDARSYLVSDGSYVILKKRDHFGGKAADLFLLISDNSIKSYGIAGVYIYGLVRENSLSLRKDITGLYRWYYPGKKPEDIDLDSKLPLEDAELVLPDVTSFRVQVYSNKAWQSDYKGKLPLGIKIVIERNDKTYDYIDWFPKS